MTVDKQKVEELTAQLLVAIGDDPNRPGIVDTPRRVAKWWAEFLDYEPGKVSTAFESITADQMVVVSGMRVYSLCEHHLLPFWCDVSIGYIADGQVLGLSKFARIAHKHAHKLQLQEQLVHQIAEEVSAMTGSRHVAVYAEGQHLCMLMRGIKTEGTMKSSVTLGWFRERPEVRAEFFSMIK
jgi:GTP cyclohydrolase I